MQVFSFIKNGYQLVPIEVEVSFVPGLPKIQFLGLPDTAIKESELRIKSALKFQGFEFPSSQQVLVNLKPSYLKKSSRGLDLAVAAAILWKSGQIDEPLAVDKTFVYGQLGLEGSVQVPSDIRGLNYVEDIDEPVFTGVPKESLEVALNVVTQLRDIRAPEFIEPLKTKIEFSPPKLKEDVMFNKEAARAMTLTAIGEHPILLAGPAGSGKTTFAECLYAVLENPNEKTFLQSLHMHELMGSGKLHWRPYVAPHHTITALAMVGGGDPIFPGEISRAHGGVLMLDEFLEFKSAAKEALREPFEKGAITIHRKGKKESFPADFYLVGTTNLCPCGDLVPGKVSSCRFSLTRCRSYVEKLSGPVLDRFQMLTYSHKWGGEAKVSMEQIYDDIRKAQNFARIRGQGAVNAKLAQSQIEKEMDPMILTNFLPEFGSSRRRKASLLKVARSVADLDESLEIRPKHLEAAAEYTLYPFERMKRIFS